MGEVYLTSRSADNNYLENIISQATKSIDIVSITLGFEAKPKLNAMFKKALEDNIKITVMLLNPKSSFYAERNKDINRDSNTSSAIDKDELKVVFQIAKEYENFGVKLFDSYPFWHLISIDEETIFCSYHPIGKFGYTDVQVIKITKDDQAFFDIFYNLILLMKEKSICTNSIK